MAAYTEVIVWGSDAFGQLGLGKKERGKLYSSPKFCCYNVLIRQVACGEDHAAFIANNGYVYSMGSNSEGRLGIGNPGIGQCSSPCLVESLVNKTAVTLSCGWGHSAVICDDGSLYTWGVGESGALGLGTTETQWLPGRVVLPFKAKSVSCGSRHTAILVGQSASDRALFTFGAGEAGQLGTGRKERELSPVQVHTAELIRQVACGVNHTLLLTDAGRVLSTGSNAYGALGTGNKLSTASPVRVTALEEYFIDRLAAGTQSAALSDRGEVFVWGLGAYGEFLLPQRLSRIPTGVKDLALGTSFGLAVDRLNGVWAWGSNSRGELGTTTYKDSSDPVLITELDGRTIRKVVCGGSFVIALGVDVGATAEKVLSPPMKANQSVYVQDSRSNLHQRLNSDITPKYYATRSPLSRPRSDKKYRSPMGRPSISRLHNTSEKEARVSRPLRQPELNLSRYSDAEPPQARATREAELPRFAREAESRTPPRRAREAEPQADRLTREPEPQRGPYESATGASQAVRPEVPQRAHQIAQDESFVDRDPSPDRLKMERRLGELERQLHTSSSELAMYRDKHELLARENARLSTELQVIRHESEDQQERSNYEMHAHIDDIRRSSSQTSNALAKQLQDLSVELDKERGQRKHLELQILEVQRENDRVTKENMSLHRRTSDAERNFKGATAEVASLELEQERLLRDLDHTAADLRRQQALMDDLEVKHRGELASRTEDMRRQHVVLKDQATHKIMELEEELAEQASVRRDRENELAEKEQQLQRLSHDIERGAQAARTTQQELSDNINRLERALEEQRVARRLAETDGAKKAEHIERLEYDLQDRGLLLKQLSEVEDELEARLAELDEGQSVKARMQRDIEVLKADNDRIKAHAEESRDRADFELAERTEAADKERQAVASHYRAQVNDLESRVEQLRVDLGRKSKDCELEAAAHRDTEARLAEEKSKNDAVSYELTRVNRELSGREADLLRLRGENDHLNASLQSLDLDRTQLARGHDQLAHTLKDLEAELAQKSLDLQDCERVMIEFKRDNEYLRRSSDDARFEVERLGSELNSHLNTVEKLHRILDEWEVKYHSLADENYRLQAELTESEAKNKALFESLEKTLAMRAKEYKDRTLSMLAVPFKGTEDDSLGTPSTGPQPSPIKTGFSRASPARVIVDTGRRSGDRSPAPRVKSEVSKDYRSTIGNTPARLLEGLGTESPLSSIRTSSPARASAVRPQQVSSRSPSQALYTRDPSKETPSKALEEIRARLASLQDNKSDLETKMKEFEYHLDEAAV
jgi:X-linked retinitis pigmentosa GTPase regulator